MFKTKSEYFDQFSTAEMRNYLHAIKTGELKINNIDKKPSELSKDELSSYMINSYGLYRFTPESISTKEAIELFKEYKSYYLCHVLPLEYLNDKDFIKKAITTVYPLSYDSFFKYANPKLKEDAELASFAIDEHGFCAVSALEDTRLVNDTNFVKSEMLKDRYIKNAKGEKELSIEVKKQITNAFFYSSPAVKKDKDLLNIVLSSNPYLYSKLDEKQKENPEIVLSTIKSLLVNENYDFIRDVERESNLDTPKFEKVVKNITKLDTLTLKEKKIRPKFMDKVKESVKDFQAEVYGYNFER